MSKYFDVLTLMNDREAEEYKQHEETILRLKKEIELAEVVIDQSRKWIADKNSELNNRHLKNLVLNVKRIPAKAE